MEEKLAALVFLRTVLTVSCAHLKQSRNTIDI